MQQLNIKFPDYTPDYILDEIKYYLIKTSNGKNDMFTLSNTMCLINLAMVNKRITKKQGKRIKYKIDELKNIS